MSNKRKCIMAVKSIKNKALKKFFYEGDDSKINPDHVESIREILTALNASHATKDIKNSFKSFDKKKGSGKGTYSINVNGNWRVTFQIEDDGVTLVDYLDYHGKQIRSK